MISAVNNHKTTGASPRPSAQGEDDASLGRGRAAAGTPQKAIVPAEGERGRGRVRERRDARPGRARRDVAAAALPTGRVVTVETSQAPLPPGLAARARCRRAVEPTQTLPASSYASQQAPTPTGSQLPIELDQYLSDLPDEAFLPHLSFRKKCAIINEALALDNALDYSTAALVLAASRRARQQEKQLNREVRFAEVAREVPMGDREMVKTYNGGTCFSLAGHLMGHIKNKFNVQSFALITEQAPLQMAFWPSLLTKNAMVGIQDIKGHVSGIGHTDVVVPYLQGSDRRALVLPTGQPIGASHQDGSITERIDLFGPERLLTEPHALAFRSLWGRVRLHIAKRRDESVFGIDFLASEMFINRHAAQNLQVLLHGREARHQTRNFDRMFSFAGLVRRDAPARSEEAEADWQRCYEFLALVNRVFNLRAEALNDIVHVIDRRHSYLEDLVHPWAVAIRDTADERAVALSLADQLAREQIKHQKTAQRIEVWTATQHLRGCLDLAQARVLAGEVDEAKAEYGKARHYAEAGLHVFAERRA